MDTTLHLQAAAKAYRTSVASLGVVIVFSALLLPIGTGAALAAALGGMVAWLPHVYMIAKVFGVTRGGVKAVNLSGLLAAEALKFLFTVGLFVLAFSLTATEHAGQLLIGFLVALAANLVASAITSRQLDRHWTKTAKAD